MATLDDRLLDFFRQLDSADQSTLLAFAEFLAVRPGAVAGAKPVAKQPLAEPESIPRPADESVVAAVKRLSKTYPMLNKSEILAETSDLVSQHIIQKRDATAVIDDLEAAFERRYLQMKESGRQD